MKFKNILLIILNLMLSLNLTALRLPVKNAKLTSTFGESRKDHFHNGIDFGGGSQKIYPFMDGNIIFYYDRADFPFENYPGGGNFVIVDHQGKMRSYYLHCKDNSINKKDFTVTETNCIAVSYDTGHSYGIHLHFQIEKMSPHEFINPLIFYKEFLTDKTKPKINGVFIRENSSDKIIRIGKEARIQPTDSLTILLDAYDKVGNKYKMAPFSITVFLNGDRTRYYKFDKLLINENKYYLYPSYSFTDIYYGGYYKVAEFTPSAKEYDIKIIVEDLWGNRTETERKIIIK